MANYAVWNVRRRHEWLATPLPKKRVKRRSARRIGLLDAWERKGTAPKANPDPNAETAEAAKD